MPTNGTIIEELSTGTSPDVLLYVGIIVVGLCVLCLISKYLSNRNSYDPFRRRFDIIILKKRKIPSQSFNKNKFRNYCGVEIECISKDRDKYSFDEDDLKKYYFSQGKDGSLSSSGVEFMSQPSQGDSLLGMIKRFTGELNKKEYYIDKTCGLHIHLEVPIKLDLIKKMYIFYSKCEDLFFKMLPKSRQKSEYCERFRKFDDYDWEDVSKIKTLGDFKKLYYETNFYHSCMKSKYADKRYCWINFHSLFYRGTLEVRAHSGTIDYEKIANWLLIHLNIINFLEKTKMDKIVKMKMTKENFLKIFTPKIKKYIKLRWKKFPRGNEEDLKCGQGARK